MGISLNPVTKIISITSPTTTVTIQELVNAIREWEDDLTSLSYAKVIDAVGKDDLGGSVTTAITMTLSDEWQIQFWDGVDTGYIKDGNLVGGVGGKPVVATGGDDTIIIQNSIGGTIATVSSESGLSTDEHDALMNLLKIETNKWEIVNNQLIIYDDNGTDTLYSFDLKDSSDSPTMQNVYKRVPI